MNLDLLLYFWVFEDNTYYYTKKREEQQSIAILSYIYISIIFIRYIFNYFDMLLFICILRYLLIFGYITFVYSLLSFIFINKKKSKNPSCRILSSS